jgi:hypothetical protein
MLDDLNFNFNEFLDFTSAKLNEGTYATCKEINNDLKGKAN